MSLHLKCADCKYDDTNNPEGVSCWTYRGTLDVEQVCQAQDKFEAVEPPVERACKNCKFESYNNPKNMGCWSYRDYLGMDEPDCDGEDKFEPKQIFKEDAEHCGTCSFAKVNNSDEITCHEYRQRQNLSVCDDYFYFNTLKNCEECTSFAGNNTLQGASCIEYRSRSGLAKCQYRNQFEELHRSCSNCLRDLVADEQGEGCNVDDCDDVRDGEGWLPVFTNTNNCTTCAYSSNNNPFGDNCEDVRNLLHLDECEEFDEYLNESHEIVSCEACSNHIDNNSTGRECRDHMELTGYDPCDNFEDFDFHEKDCSDCKFNFDATGTKTTGNCPTGCDSDYSEWKPYIKCDSCKFHKTNNGHDVDCNNYVKAGDGEILDCQDGDEYEELIKVVKTVDDKDRECSTCKNSRMNSVSGDFCEKDCGYSYEHWEEFVNSEPIVEENACIYCVHSCHNNETTHGCSKVLQCDDTKSLFEGKECASCPNSKSHSVTSCEDPCESFEVNGYEKWVPIPEEKECKLWIEVEKHNDFELLKEFLSEDTWKQFIIAVNDAGRGFMGSGNQLIDDAFMWANSYEGHEYWSDLNAEFVRFKAKSPIVRGIDDHKDYELLKEFLSEYDWGLFTNNVLNSKEETFRDYSEIIDAGFVWDRAEEGHRYWEDLNAEFVRFKDKSPELRAVERHKDCYRLKEFLSEDDWEKFVVNVEIDRLHRNSGSPIIDAAFVWSITEEGQDYWRERNINFKAHLDESCVGANVGIPLESIENPCKDISDSISEDLSCGQCIHSFHNNVTGNACDNIMDCGGDNHLFIGKSCGSCMNSVTNSGSPCLVYIKCVGSYDQWENVNIPVKRGDSCYTCKHSTKNSGTSCVQHLECGNYTMWEEYLPPYKLDGIWKDDVEKDLKAVHQVELEDSIMFKKGCTNCEHEDLNGGEEPCVDCTSLYEGWEEKKDILKTCPNCEHEDLRSHEEPCDSCTDRTNWIPKIKIEKIKIISVDISDEVCDTGDSKNEAIYTATQTIKQGESKMNDLTVKDRTIEKAKNSGIVVGRISAGRVLDTLVKTTVGKAMPAVDLDNKYATAGIALAASLIVDNTKYKDDEKAQFAIQGMFDNAALKGVEATGLIEMVEGFIETALATITFPGGNDNKEVEEKKVEKKEDVTKK